MGLRLTTVGLALCALGCDGAEGSPELHLPGVGDAVAEIPPRRAPVRMDIDARGVATHLDVMFATETEAEREALGAALRRTLVTADRAFRAGPEPVPPEQRAALSLAAHAGLPARRVEEVLEALGPIGLRHVLLEVVAEDGSPRAVAVELPFRGIVCPPYPPDPLVVCGGAQGEPALVLHRWHAEPLDDYLPEMLGGREVGSMSELLALVTDTEWTWLQSTAEARWEDTVRVAAALRRADRRVLFRATHVGNRPEPSADRTGELTVLRLPDVDAAAPGGVDAAPADTVTVEIGADEVAEHAGRRYALRSEHQRADLAVTLTTALRRADRDASTEGQARDLYDDEQRAPLLLRADGRAPAATVELLLRALAPAGPRSVRVAVGEGKESVFVSLAAPSGTSAALAPEPPLPLLVLGARDARRGEPPRFTLYRWELASASGVPVPLEPLELHGAADLAQGLPPRALVRVQSSEVVRWEHAARIHAALSSAGLRGALPTGDVLERRPR